MFSHDSLTHEEVLKTASYAYRRAVLPDPSFWFQRFFRGIKTGELFYDFYYFVKFLILPATSETHEANYYARDRWPVYDFASNPPMDSEYQIVGSGKVKKIA